MLLLRPRTGNSDRQEMVMRESSPPTEASLPPVMQAIQVPDPAPEARFDGIIRLDEFGVIDSINPAALRIFSYRREAQVRSLWERKES